MKTPEEIRKIIYAWNEKMRECDQRMDELSQITGCIIESPLGNAVYGLMYAYSAIVAESIDWSE